jgi:hypothetical protein
MEPLTLDQQELLEKIRHHLAMLGRPFQSRLAMENKWSPLLTQRVMEEYVRFLFIAREGGNPVSPSYMIDKVWHLHLLYTDAYWNDLCPNILKMNLSHCPHTGVGSENEKFAGWFKQNLESYRTFFGEPPRIWTSPDPAPRQRTFQVLSGLFCLLGLASIFGAVWLSIFSYGVVIVIVAILMLAVIFYRASCNPFASTSTKCGSAIGCGGGNCTGDSSSGHHGLSDGGGGHGGGHSCGGGGHSCGGGGCGGGGH